MRSPLRMLAYRWCLRAGVFDAEKLLEEGDPDQWAMWHAFSLLEPWGDEWGQVAKLIGVHCEEFDELEWMPIPDEIKAAKRRAALLSGTINQDAIAARF